VALLPHGWIECEASGRVLLRDVQGQTRRQLAGSTAWSWVFCNQCVVLVHPTRAEVWDARLEQQLGAWELPGLTGAILTDDGRHLGGIESNGDISLWSLPHGQPLGSSQPFDPRDLPHLKFVTGHGLALACAGKECGVWFLEDGEFEWLRFGEPWFSGVHPLPGKRILLLTQDGSWHLYGGRPLRRLISLTTTQDGGWLALAEDGRWDSNPELYGRVLLESGGSTPPPQPDLWESLFTCAPSALPAAGPAASPNPA